MAYYRLYFLDHSTGRINSVETFESNSEPEALAWAENYVSNQSKELWCGSRKLEEFVATNICAANLGPTGSKKVERTHSERESSLDPAHFQQAAGAADETNSVVTPACPNLRNSFANSNIRQALVEHVDTIPDGTCFSIQQDGSVQVMSANGVAFRPMQDAAVWLKQIQKDRQSVGEGENESHLSFITANKGRERRY